MSKNIDQVYNTNPITTNVSTDLMYFGRSPYGAGDDAAVGEIHVDQEIDLVGADHPLFGPNFPDGAGDGDDHARDILVRRVGDVDVVGPRIGGEDRRLDVDVIAP